jgi:hypothetical protein
MNSEQKIKVGAAAFARLEFHLPAPPNAMLRNWIRAVDLQKGRKHFSEKLVSSGGKDLHQRRRISIRFIKSNRKRLKVSLAKPVPPR